jgi:hypothetical protein
VIPWYSTHQEADMGDTYLTEYDELQREFPEEDVMIWRDGGEWLITVPNTPDAIVYCVRAQVLGYSVTTKLWGKRIELTLRKA